MEMPTIPWLNAECLVYAHASLTRGDHDRMSSLYWDDLLVPRMFLKVYSIDVNLQSYSSPNLLFYQLGKQFVSHHSHLFLSFFHPPTHQPDIKLGSETKSFSMSLGSHSIRKANFSPMSFLFRSFATLCFGSSCSVCVHLLYLFQRILSSRGPS
jgi:hypothetical protein